MTEHSDAPVSRATLHALLDSVPDQHIPTLAAMLQAPAEEDPIPLADEMAVRIALQRADPQPAIPHEEILREFGM